MYQQSMSVGTLKCESLEYVGDNAMTNSFFNKCDSVIRIKKLFLHSMLKVEGLWDVLIGIQMDYILLS